MFGGGFPFGNFSAGGQDSDEEGTILYHYRWIRQASR